MMRRSAIAVLVPALLASCVAPPDRVPPRPVAPVTVAPPPAVAAPAAAEPGEVEIGSWSYVATPGGSSARFGPMPGSVALSFDCTGGAVTMRILRANPSARDASAVLRASTTLRSVAVTGGDAFGTARLTARDPILDALAFSRGKFGVAIDGRERWYPAWPEVTRVIEDCRA